MTRTETGNNSKRRSAINDDTKAQPNPTEGDGGAGVNLQGKDGTAKTGRKRTAPPRTAPQPTC